MPIPVLRALLGLALLSLAATPVEAAPIHLEDGVGFVEVDPESQDGASAWTVNGVQHLRTQWFWIQVANTGAPLPERSLDTIHSVAAASDASGDGQDETLDVGFDGLASILYEVDLHIELASTAIGAPVSELFSQLTTDLTIRAPEGGAVLRLFQYSDVDLFGSYADDDAVFTGGTAFVTDSSGLGSYESSWDRAPDAVEAAIYDATLASLNDGAPTSLSGSTHASGDVTLAAMWEVVIADGGTFTLRQTQTIRVVPEPGVATLVALGLAALAARRREGSR